MRRIRCLTLAAIFCSTPLVLAQPPAEQRYVISIGTASEKISSGAIWLYSISSYNLQKTELAAIENGVALIVDIERLKKELDRNPDTDPAVAYVIAVQIGPYDDHLHYLWYRTPGILAEDFWTEFLGSINSLGQATALSAGETQLILPSPVDRHITLHYLDGRPAVNADLNVSVYLWDNNRCATHFGLDLGSFHTDKTGTVEIPAPLVDLYLEGVSYYEEVGSGPAGAAYSHNWGMRIGSEDNLVLKEAWEFTDDDSLTDEYELQVLTAAGKPRSNVDIYGNWRTNTCGGGDRIGQTDAKGIARIDLDPSFTDLGLNIGGPYSSGDPMTCTGR